MSEINELLTAYEVDVDSPDVSGMEHLQMLMTRNRLHELEKEMSTSQKQRVLAADQKLLKQAALFFAEIESIADLAKWRQREAITPEQWWWYLDVLTQLPEGTTVPSR